MSDVDQEEKKKVSNCSFFRVRKRPAKGQMRQRKRSSSPEDKSDHSDEESNNSANESDEGNVVVRIDRKKQKRGIGSGAVAKKKSKGKDSESSSSDEDESKHISKVGVIYKSAESTDQNKGDMGATATNEYDTDMTRDARAIEERAKETRAKIENPLEDKVYRGLNSYAKYIEKKDSAAGSAAKMSTGPQRASSNIRATVRWDYAPDICKDYKETGYCGFGDSCKFMHDRGDYKFGWQLEREMQEGTYGEDDGDDGKYEISSDDEDLPFKCLICRESFKTPIVTKCMHYFCEKCALDHYRKSQRCFACGKQTSGVFNPAKNLIAKLEKVHAAEEQAAKNDSSDDSDE